MRRTEVSRQENRITMIENKTKNPTRALTGAGSKWKVAIIPKKTSDSDMESRNIVMTNAGMKKESTGPNMFSTKEIKMTERGVDRLSRFRKMGEGVRGRCSCTKYAVNAIMRKEYDSSVGPGVEGSAKRKDNSVR